MPIEIKEIIVKAVVENKIENNPPGKQDTIELNRLNIELMMEELLKRVKTKNER